MSAEVVRDVSNALVVAAEAARTSATAFARMLSESEAEREKLTLMLVRSEAAYAGLLVEKEAASQNAAGAEGRIRDLISETLLLRELEETARAWSRGAPYDQGALSKFGDLFNRLDAQRGPF